jgi:hypothetical protein
MRLLLVYCWKEWRAQRGTLLGYLAIAFACILAGTLLAPPEWWHDKCLAVRVVSWGVLGGVLGASVFVAPNLVGGEFVGKDDQFVRRLPGALAPAFGGKLLFLVLAAAALPLAGYLFGQLTVLAHGESWCDLLGATWGTSGRGSPPGAAYAQEVLDLGGGERLLARVGATIAWLDPATGGLRTLFPRD